MYIYVKGWAGDVRPVKELRGQVQAVEVFAAAEGQVKHSQDHLDGCHVQA